MKICHLTSVHLPTDNRIVHKECASLLQSGHEVILVYLGNRIKSDNGLQYVVAGTKPKSRWIRLTTGIWRVFFAALRQKADVYHFHDPELLLVGILLHYMGHKVIFDVHEDLPYQVKTKEYLPKIVCDILGKVIYIYERLAGCCLDGIITVAESIENRYKARKSICIFNYPKLIKIHSDSISWAKKEKAFAYIGGLTVQRNIFGMMEAANIHNCILYIAGQYESESLRKNIQEKYLSKYENLHDLGFLQRDNISELLQNVCGGLCVLQPTPQYLLHTVRSTKLFEYMMAGIPVIISDFPNVRDFVEKAQCGICVNPLDIEAIGDAMQWLLDNPQKAEKMGNNGREYIIKYCNWEVEAKKLDGFYKKIMED